MTVSADTAEHGDEFLPCALRSGRLVVRYVRVGAQAELFWQLRASRGLVGLIQTQLILYERHPVTRPDGQQPIVEVVLRIVNHA